MTISDSDAKLLWGRAAAFCSNPSCRADLSILSKQNPYNIGEMAHIIAKSPVGPRGANGGGEDKYENLILLCPTCHRMIDKAPDGDYPEVTLYKWKSEHENFIRKSASNQKFETKRNLKKFIAPILGENKMLWMEFGPYSETAISDPGSNLCDLWTLRKIDRIIPNNIKIINVIQANMGLLNSEEIDAYLKFKTHVEAFEQHQYNRLDSYPRFPTEFSDLFNL